MSDVFRIYDKSKRKIRLTQERWKHISQEHPQIIDLDEIKKTLENPYKTTPSKYDPENVAWYYHFIKHKKRYLFVAVKYLNGEGFIITAYYMRSIK